MKRFFTLLLITVSFSASAQTGATGAVTQSVNVIPSVIFPETEYNFGKIPQGKPVTHVFIVKNAGNKPLVLDNVQASCGCTTPQWSGEPVAPGQTTEIKVGYNAAGEGSFDKSISITFNGTEHKQLNIKGEVWKTPADSAPYNSAVLNLKNQQ